MRRMHESGYSVADNLIAAFYGAGHAILPGDKILDFGCGAGGLVYEFRDRGFDAYGFEIHDRVEYRDLSDRSYFGFLDKEAQTTADTSDTTIDAAKFRIPFANDTFDVAISTSVIEHVMDLNPMMAEVSRVLKPDGVAYHLYPNKGVFIEPHMYVPFGSRFQSWWYFYMWALAGIKNDFQQDFSAKQIADANYIYTKTGLRYYTRDELREICSQFFNENRFVDDMYYPGVKRWVFWQNRLDAFKDPHPIRALSRALKMGSMISSKKIIRDQS